VQGLLRRRHAAGRSGASRECPTDYSAPSCYRACFHPHRQDIQKFKLGLYLALSFYRNAHQQQQQQQQQPSAQPSPGGPSSGGGGGPAQPAGPGPPRRAAAGGFARCEGAGAEAAQLEQWLLSLMLLHVGTALHDMAANAPPADAPAAPPPPAEALRLARLALHTCVLLRRPQVLFERAFPLFSGAAPQTQGLAAYLEAIEPAVVADVLQARAAPPGARKGSPGCFRGAGAAAERMLGTACRLRARPA
jgi:hypothetical protein